MKKLLTAFIFLALAGGGGYYWYTTTQVTEKPQVITGVVSRGDVTQKVTATGTLEALRTVPVGSQVSGTVKELYVDFNSLVKAGDIIAEIDPTLLQVQVQIQEANIARQQVDIASQEVQLENDKLNLSRAEQQYNKPVPLITKQALEQSQLQVKTRQAQIESAKKQMVQTQASLDQAKLNVAYCTIRSPIDGVVINRQVDKGQTVQSSMTVQPFVTLATDLRHLKLTGGVDEADIGFIRPGQSVNFRVDAYQNSVFTGTVNSVRLNAISQQNVVTYQVVIDVLNPDYRLRTGMTANLDVIIETAPNVLKVPAGALRFRPSTDIYVALGLTPPQAGQRGMAAGAKTGTTPPGAPGATPAPPPSNSDAPTGTKATPQNGTKDQQPKQQADAQPGQGTQPGGKNRQPGGGRGFGSQSGAGQLTPEQMAAMAERFGRGGGGSGRGGGQGRGGRSNRPANEVTTPIVPMTDRSATATKIDELFAPVQRPQTPGTVWTWDEKNKALKQIRLTLGISDGQFSEVLSGDVQEGMQVVTGVILPVVKTTAPGSNPLMQQQRGGPGGFGNPGGGPGGGGGRGGGGGGGRGGL